ncbi:SPARC-like protein 1 isoform X2 [Hyperolius riggenbachi]|uniref:SPARC-like protein 1 isoform X2 n=1 Tax=Hyperolius riggenbachi TaxID=752182 RepID=UPI0035A35658
MPLFMYNKDPLLSAISHAPSREKPRPSREKLRPPSRTLWRGSPDRNLGAGGRIMKLFIEVSCIVLMFFVSTVTSFLVKHVRHGHKITEGIQDQDMKDWTLKKNTSKAVRFIAGEHHVESIDHSKSKINTFPSESILVTHDEGKEKNSPLDLNKPLSPKNNNNKQENFNKSEDYEDIVDDAVDTWITEYPESKLKNPVYKSDESDDEQSGDGPTSLTFSEEHENSPIRSNTGSVELNEDIDKEYVNILEKILDEDLKYILNVTDNNMTGEQFHNKSSTGLIFRVADHEKIGSDSRAEGENIISKQDGSGMDGDDHESVYRSKTENQYPRHEEKYTNKTNENQELGNVTDKTTVVPNVVENSQINSSDIQADHHDHNIDVTMKKEVINFRTNKTTFSAGPCANFHCKRGKTCKTDKQENAFCACQEPDLCQPANINDRVCGTDNKTYTSDCHLFATKCQLEGTKEESHLHLDYRGPCIHIPPCTDYELAHFPFRMRDWLKNVLMQLYERGQENPDILSEKQRTKVKKIYEDERRLHKGDHNIELLEKDFQKNYHMYVYPVHWQFNQLDQHSTDRLLTRSELSPLRAPLIPMEHCVTAFLQGCNMNDDKYISLREWCHCFGIRDGDIDEDLLF